MKNYFKRLILICSLFICALLPYSAYAIIDDSPLEKEYVIIVDYDYAQFDVAPIVESGRVLVPVRAIAETLKIAVLWDAKEQKVTLTGENKNIVLTVGEKIAFVDGKTILLDVPARIVNGRTMVPLRFVGESLGKNVYYNSAYNYVDFLAGKQIIWVCSFDLLEEDDYSWEELKKNYIDLGRFCYELKEGALTYRGIKLGDSIEKAKEKYGIPAKHSKNIDGSECISYVSEYIAGSSIAIFLELTFDNNVLIKVVIARSV
jgi:hypothetical protein